MYVLVFRDFDDVRIQFLFAFKLYFLIRVIIFIFYFNFIITEIGLNLSNLTSFPVVLVVFPTT
jgi:hypothetical protein